MRKPLEPSLDDEKERTSYQEHCSFLAPPVEQLVKPLAPTTPVIPPNLSSYRYGVIKNTHKKDTHIRVPYKMTKTASVSKETIEAIEGFRVGDYTGLAKLLRTKNSIDLFEFCIAGGDILADMLQGKQNPTGCELHLRKLGGGALKNTKIGQNKSPITALDKAVKYGRRLDDAGMRLKDCTAIALRAAVAPETKQKREALTNAGLSPIVVEALIMSDDKDDRKTKASMLKDARVSYEMQVAYMAKTKSERVKLLKAEGASQAVIDACNINIPAKSTLYTYWDQYNEHIKNYSLWKGGITIT